MSQTEDQLGEKLAAAWRMPYGRGQIAAVEDIIRHADAQDFRELGFAARMLATAAYTFGGEPGKAVVTFSWCLTAFDRGAGDRAFDHDLYWQFKWMAAALTKFPEVALERTYAVLDDMERRYRLAGHTLNPVHQHREVVAQHVGDVSTADERYRLWCAAPRGEMSDCIGCEPTSKVRHLTWRGRDEDAVALALPVLGGELTCVEQPQSILTELLVPYLRTGRLEEAAAAHRQAYRAIQANRGELGMVADHVAFCAYTENEARGLELIERQLGWLDEPPTPLADMYFSASAALVLGRVPADVPVRDTTAGALYSSLSERALALAERFDARNGTSAQGDTIRALLVAEPIVSHLPLSGPARRASRRAAAVVAPTGTPEELADLALREARLRNEAAADAAWARFDEVCPTPAGALLARRLDARAGDLARTDPAAAAEAWTEAAALFESLGDEVRRQAVLGRHGLLRCYTGDIDKGLSTITATVSALASRGDDDAHARALTRLAVGYRLAGRTADALAVLEQARSLASAPELHAEIALDSADCAASLEEFDSALSFAERSMSLYSSIGPCGGLRLAQHLAGRLTAASGSLERAFDLFGEAALTDSIGLRGDALHFRGRIALDLDRHEDARSALIDAVADLIAAGDVAHATYARVDLAAACLATGHPSDAADAVEEAITALDEGDELARASFLLARAHRDLGLFEQALTLLDQVAAHCVAQENPAGVGQMHAMSGEILDQLDRDAEAAGHFTTAADAYATTPLSLAELENRRRAALSWRWAGKLDESLAALTEADSHAQSLSPDDPSAVWEVALLNYDGARILAAASRPADALSRIASASDAFRTLDATVEAAMADALHGRLLLDLDRPAEAEPLLTAALTALPEDATTPAKNSPPSSPKSAPNPT